MEDFCQQTETEDMLARDKISLPAAETDPHQQRVPARHMVGDEKKRSVGLQFFTAQVEFRAQNGPDKNREKAIDPNMSPIGVHIFRSPPD